MKIQKRRDFLQHISVGTGAILCGLSVPASHAADDFLPSVACGRDTSTVVIASSGVTASESNYSHLLDMAIEPLFDQPASDVWKTLFSPKDIVGLKVNCLAGKGLSTHPELVRAVIARLRRIGIPDKQIIIWDRLDRDLTRAGYKVIKGGNRIQCFGNDNAGYTRDIYEYGAVGSQLSNIIQQHCTAVINLPIMKDHGIVGVSGAMKNFFGAINNPNKYHENNGDPFVADVNMLPAIRRKTRLTVCDAFSPQYEGGPPYMPEWTWAMNSLIAAVDPVAMDTVIWDIIERKRHETGLQSLTEAGRRPSYIGVAADDKHQIGTDQMKRISLKQVS